MFLCESRGVADPYADLALTHNALSRVTTIAETYLHSLATRKVYDPGAAKLVADLGGPLPEQGRGTLDTIDHLLDIGTAAATASSGPRFFHFVTGGSTPAALAADWATSLLDQNSFARASSAFGHEIETVAIDWLRSLFGLPEGWGGALVASATFANFTSLGCATHWWGEPTRFATACPACRGCRCSPADTCTPAPARRCRCWATAGTRSRCARETRSAGWTWTRWLGAWPSWTAPPR
jgi:hypothetical protein